MLRLKGVTLFMTIRTVRFFVLAILPGLLAGCQERENANPFMKEKGVYSGKADETLSDETNQKLRRRMIIQRGGSI
jgi:hypothetical protein